MPILQAILQFKEGGEEQSVLIGSVESVNREYTLIGLWCCQETDVCVMDRPSHADD